MTCEGQKPLLRNTHIGVTGRQTCFVAALDPPTCILSLYLSRKIMSCYKLAFFGQNRKK